MVGIPKFQIFAPLAPIGMHSISIKYKIKLREIFEFFGLPNFYHLFFFQFFFKIFTIYFFSLGTSSWF